MRRRLLLAGLAAPALLAGMRPLRAASASGAASAAAAPPLMASGNAFRELLDTPALRSPLAERGLFNGLARAGSRWVAVGQRGHILTSDDQGAHWQQAEVPVSSDLVAVCFADAQRGWAVGHDGIILHSADAGRHWQRQWDGRRLGPRGAETPMLDVAFRDARNGLAVGAFGSVLRTDDGGATWTSAPELVDNPKGLHLYALRNVGSHWYIAGEQGLLLRQDGQRPDSRFVPLALPYAGTLFGIVGNEQVLLVHGLRGSLLRSADAGQTWQSLPTGLNVGLTGSAIDPSGDPTRARVAIVSQAGHVLLSRDAGASFALLPSGRAAPASAVALADAGRQLLLAGPRGLSRLAL